MIEPAVLEGLARDVHDSTGAAPPIDALELAEACGCTVRPWMRGRGARDGDVIRYPAKARPVRQHGVVAHELGHWLLEDAGLDPDDEGAARYLAGALMLPRSAFIADLDATDWDLFRLQDRHPNASAEMIVCRMTQVSPATAWVWDAGKLARRYGAADDELAAAVVDRVLTLEQPVADGAVRAWPVFDGSWRRVLVVARAA